MDNTRVKKIVLMIPSLQSGGMEKVMSIIASYLNSLNEFEIHMVLYGRSRKVFYSIPKEIKVHKPHFEYTKGQRILFILKTLNYIRRNIRKIHPDSILSFGEYWNSLVLLSLFRLNYPIYISDRCSPEKGYNVLHTFLRKILYPTATGIIAQTRIAKKYIEQEIKHENVVVIGNPVNLETIYTDQHHQKKKKKIVLTIGRLIATKNHDKLIRLFSEINLPDWKLVIVGGDALKQKNSVRLKRLVSELNQESRILVEGEQSDIQKYYAEGSIFAFTSTSEGFPNVISEAMANGIPAVAFDCVAGPSDLITDSFDGYLLEVNDYQGFRGKLEDLMMDEELRKTFGRNAVASIKKYSTQIVGQQIKNFVLDCEGNSN